MSHDSGYDGSDIALKEVIISEIIRGTMEELRNGKAITLRNLVDIYKARMAEHGVIDPRTSGALRNDMRRIVTTRICERMDGIELQNLLENASNTLSMLSDNFNE